MKKCTARVDFTAFGVFSAGLYFWTQPWRKLRGASLGPSLNSEVCGFNFTMYELGTTPSSLQ